MSTVSASIPSEHAYFLLEAAASGLGVAIGSYPLVEPDLKSGRLAAPLGFVPTGSSHHLLNATMTPNRAKSRPSPSG
jgi:DNA-binding transcriptional LysR family regulator